MLFMEFLSVSTVTVLRIMSDVKYCYSGTVVGRLGVCDGLKPARINEDN